jgi:thiamine pyrophosphate-dependent acetolactate synthase large subunit-like protein
VVSGLGSPCWDLAAAGDNARNFYVWVAMGGACMLALGLATARPNERVLAIVGDGEMLMGLGSLATIAVRRASFWCTSEDGEGMVIGNEPANT